MITTAISEHDGVRSRASGARIKKGRDLREARPTCLTFEDALCVCYGLEGGRDSCENYIGEPIERTCRFSAAQVYLSRGTRSAVKCLMRDIKEETAPKPVPVTAIYAAATSGIEGKLRGYSSNRNNWLDNGPGIHRTRVDPRRVLAASPQAPFLRPANVNNQARYGDSIA